MTTERTKGVVYSAVVQIGEGIIGDISGIGFVRQAIGHSKIDTTSRYIENLSEEKRKLRIESIN